MVYYFIIGADGNRYGPSDIDTLVQWTREGRIVESTLLVERGTERQLRADSITAIVAELRRGLGVAPVSIEREASPRPEAPTMTHPGHGPAAIPWAQAQPPVAGHAAPTAPGVAPPAPFPQTMPYGRNQMLSSRSKIAAGLLGIFLGPWGVHRFYLGYIGIGFLQIFATLCTFGVAGLWGFIEGILCLTGSMRDVDGRELRD